jgi:CubicO group peptidase (beta-lactamase class C family)
MDPRLVSPESEGFTTQRLARIQPAMQRYVDQLGFAGISTLLARRGQVVHSSQVGWQERETNTPMAADTIFRIYSMTKPIICTALMMLHEEGRFQLFHPVAKYLPAFAELRVLTNGKEEDLARPMLIRDLFTHTAGLTYNFLEDSPVGAMYLQAGLMSDATHTLERIIAELARFPLAFQPGSRWHYSMSIDVLAHLIEVLSGQPLAEFLHRRLFAPLDMHDTAFAVTDENLPRLAAVYGHPDIATHTFSQHIAAWQSGDNQRRDLTQTYPATKAPNFARGGHGLFSTASDYLRFAHMLLSGCTSDGERLLSRKTLALMHTNHVAPALLPYMIGPFPANGYGFGLGSRVLLNVAESCVPGSTGEVGWAGAAKTFYWIDPQEEIIGILMSQFMVSFELPEKDFQVLAYAALMD